MKPFGILFSSIGCDPKEAREQELCGVRRAVQGEQAPEREERLWHDLLSECEFTLRGEDQHPTGQAEQRTRGSPALKPPAGTTTGPFLSSLLVSYTSMEQLTPHAKDSSAFRWEGSLVFSGGQNYCETLRLTLLYSCFSLTSPFLELSGAKGEDIWTWG